MHKYEEAAIDASEQSPMKNSPNFFLTLNSEEVPTSSDRCWAEEVVSPTATAKRGDFFCCIEIWPPFVVSIEGELSAHYHCHEGIMD